MSKNIRQILLPLIASFIWGYAFIFQKQATEANIPAFAYNAARSLIAAIILGFILLIKKLLEKRNIIVPISRSKKYCKHLFTGGLLCGTFLTSAVNLQQIGIAENTAGKAGFLTALYIILVPLLSVFFKKKATFPVWISVAIATFGLYFLSVKESFVIVNHDILLVICALCFAFHIITVSYISEKVDGFELSCFQFVFCFMVSGIISLIVEPKVSIDIFGDCAVSILYVGIFSSAIGYTLQILAQKGTNPTVVSLLMSLEAFFSALMGAVVLGERLSPREYLGCALMLIAVIFAQLPEKKQNKDCGQS